MKRIVLLVVMIMSIIQLNAQQRYQLKKGDTIIIDGTEIVHNPRPVIKSPQPARTINNPPVVVEINHNYTGRGYTGGELAPNPSPIPPHHVCDHSHCVPDPIEPQYDAITFMHLGWFLLLVAVTFLLYFLYKISKQPGNMTINISKSAEPTHTQPVINNNYTPNSEVISNNNNLEDKTVTTNDKKE